MKYKIFLISEQCSHSSQMGVSEAFVLKLINRKIDISINPMRGVLLHSFTDIVLLEQRFGLQNVIVAEVY